MFNIWVLIKVVFRVENLQKVWAQVRSWVIIRDTWFWTGLIKSLIEPNKMAGNTFEQNVQLRLCFSPSWLMFLEKNGTVCCRTWDYYFFTWRESPPCEPSKWPLMGKTCGRICTSASPLKSEWNKEVHLLKRWNCQEYKIYSTDLLGMLAIAVLVQSQIICKGWVAEVTSCTTFFSSFRMSLKKMEKIWT